MALDHTNPLIYFSQDSSVITVKAGSYVSGPLQLGSTRIATTVQLLGAGNSTTNKTNTSNGNFMDFRLENSSSSGYNPRGLYLKFTLSGTNSTGEAIRAYTVVSGANTGSGGSHCIHATFEVGASGTLATSNDNAAVRGQVTLNAATNSKLAPLYSEFYAGTAAADTTASQCGAWIVCKSTCATGCEAGRTLIESHTQFLDLSDSGTGSPRGWTSGAGAVFRSGLTASTVYGALTAALKVSINGVQYYLPLATAIV